MLLVLQSYRIVTMYSILIRTHTHMCVPSMAIPIPIYVRAYMNTYEYALFIPKNMYIERAFYCVDRCKHIQTIEWNVDDTKNKVRKNQTFIPIFYDIVYGTGQNIIYTTYVLWACI